MQYCDIDKLNRMIFQEGNIQTSMEHIAALNQQPPVPFKPPHLDQCPSAGYHVLLTGYAAYVLKLEAKHAQFGALNNSINQLRSIPRPMDGSARRGSVDTRMVDTGTHELYYEVNSGQVLLFNVVPKKAVHLARIRKEKPGLYKVRLGPDGQWAPAKINAVSTGYAAVNGMNNDLQKATWLMALHLERQFGKGEVKEFTLFHNPSIGGKGDLWECIRDKVGITTSVTKQFCGVLQQTQKSGKAVKWVAHSQGGIIFSEAVRYHLNGNSSHASLGGFNGAFKNREEVSLDRNSVAFHANGNNNFRTKFLLDRAGIRVIPGPPGGEYDLVYVFAGMNSLSVRRHIGSWVYCNHVFAGTVQQSPHTTPQDHDEWRNNLLHGPGKGRNGLQKVFDKVASAREPKGVKFIPNHLK